MLELETSYFKNINLERAAWSNIQNRFFLFSFNFESNYGNEI